jgi:cysteine desulfurase/selenocysteine lyase
MDSNVIREDFPLYSSKDKDIIYLDSACQTLRPRQVIEAMDAYYTDFPACGGRSVHRLATEVSIKVDEARERIARFIGAPRPENVIFTKNCTEALNLVAKGLPLRKGEVVVTSDIEHNSNHVPWMQVQRQKGVERRFVETPDDGLFDLERLKAAVDGRTKVVSLVHTNNITGTTIPGREVVQIAHEKGALVMLDGAQTAPHQKVDVRALDVDLYAFSMHKMLGPSGVGVLYAKDGVIDDVEPLISGGGAVGLTDRDKVEYLPIPERFEGGLLNYAGIIGSGAAVDYLAAAGMEEVEAHDRLLNARTTKGLEGIGEVEILRPLDPGQRSSVLSFNVNGMNSHDVAMILDEMAKVAIRSGMHCVHPYFLARKMPGAARASFYLYNTIEECDKFVSAVASLAQTFAR